MRTSHMVFNLFIPQLELNIPSAKWVLLLGQLLVSLQTLKIIGKPKSYLQTMTENLSGIDLLRCPLVIFQRSVSILD